MKVCSSQKTRRWAIPPRRRSLLCGASEIVHADAISAHAKISRPRNTQPRSCQHWPQPRQPRRHITRDRKERSIEPVPNVGEVCGGGLDFRWLISSSPRSFYYMDGFSIFSLSQPQSRPFPRGCGCNGVTRAAPHGLILVIPGAEIRLAGFQVFNLGIRGPEGVDAIVGRRDLCELLHVRRFRLRLYRLHRIGLPSAAGGRTKAIGDRLTTLLADARAAERLKYPGLWCLGWQGIDLRAKASVFLRLLAGKPFLLGAETASPDRISPNSLRP